MTGDSELIGGSLCLDFHNTVSWKEDRVPEEKRIPTYRDLVTWAVDAGALPTDQSGHWLELAESQPTKGDQALAEALDLRDALHGVFSPMARGAHPSAVSLDALQKWIRRLPLRLRSSGSRFAWDWNSHEGDLSSVLWAIVWSAVELLRSDALTRIGECAAQDCRWLFLDRSRRHNRKWCDMRDCGNRAKVRRHYQRAKRTQRPDA